MASAHEQWMNATQLVRDAVRADRLTEKKATELTDRLNEANIFITRGEEGSDSDEIRHGLEIIREVHKEMRASMQT